MPEKISSDGWNLRTLSRAQACRRFSRQEVAVDVAASLDEVLTAIAWEAAGNRTESPEWYTDLEEDNELLLDDDLLADIALANED